MTQTKRATVIRNWLGRIGIQFFETLIQAEQERCSTTEGLFNTLINKFKPQYNETIKHYNSTNKLDK